jgi:hypothetical protein
MNRLEALIRSRAGPGRRRLVRLSGARMPRDRGHIVEMTLGNPDAPVTMIEYASFTCPHCATFHQGV